MRDRINLEERAADMFDRICYDMKTLDLDAMRDAINQVAPEEADNACIYTHHCLQILDDYESERCVPSESELGGNFRSDQWREAATAWAYEVARAVLESKAAEIVDEIEEAADELADAISTETDDEQAPSVDELTITSDCPHGWAAHDREDGAGTCYWVSRQLDGCNALAVKAGPVWLSWTWTPETVDAEAME